MRISCSRGRVSSPSTLVYLRNQLWQRWISVTSPSEPRKARRSHLRPSIEALEVRALLSAGGPPAGPTIFIGANAKDSGAASFQQAIFTAPVAAVTQGQVYSLTGQVTDSLPGVAITVAIDWNDGSGFLTSNVSVVDGFFTATHTYKASGTYDVSIQATDSAGLTATLSAGSSPVIVLPPTPSNLTLNLASSSVTEGDTVSLPVTFVSTGHHETDNLNIDWGDGSPIQTISVVADIAGLFALPTNLIPTHQYTNTTGKVESHHVTVTLTSGAGSANSPLMVTQSILVAPAPIVVAVTSNFKAEGSTSSFSVGLTDPGSRGNHWISVNWNDGSTTLQPISMGTSTSITVTHVYANMAPTSAGYSPTFTISRSIDPKSSRFGSATVTGVVPNVAPVFVGGISFSDANGNPIAGPVYEGDTFTATGKISEPGNLIAPAVMITWGDGTTSPAPVKSDGTFRASHQFVDTATSVTAMVTDTASGASFVSTTQPITVLDIAPTIGNVSILPSTVPSAGSLFQVSVNEAGAANTLSYAWTVDGNPIAASIGINTTSTLIPSGSHVVQCHVVDKHGLAATYSTMSISGDGTLTATNSQLANAGVSSATIIAGAGNDVLDASSLSSAYSSYLIGGTGNDTIIGGPGFTTVVAHHNADINTASSSGARIYIDSHSTVTVQANQGSNNVLDFSMNSFGVKFDLSQVTPTLATSPIQDIANAAAGALTGEHFVQAAGRFTEIIGSAYPNLLTAASGATLIGGSGNDTFLMPSGLTTGVSIIAAAGANSDANQIVIGAQSIVSGLNVVSTQGAAINAQNAGVLLGSAQTAALTVFQDGTGSGGGIFSFTNKSTGTITGTTSISTSGSVGVIFTNYGSMSSDPASSSSSSSSSSSLSGSTLIGPVLSFYGDGLGSNSSIIAFFNTATGTIFGDLSINAQAGTSVVFENDGQISGTDNSGTSINVSGNGILQAENFGSIAGVWNLTGGTNDNFVYQSQTASSDKIDFTGGHGSNTLLNEGLVGGIVFDASASTQSSNLNLLENTGAAISSASGSVPAIEMLGGAGPNDLINFAGGTGFAINMYGGSGPDILYNAASNLPSITLTAGAGDASLFNYGDSDADITLIGGAGSNLLENLGPDAGSLTLIGGSGSNDMYVARSIVGLATLIGGSGTNAMNIESGSVNNVSFTGGPGNDSLRITGQVVQSLSFNGEGGNNSIELDGQLTSTGQTTLTTNIILGTTGNNVAILDGLIGSAASPVTIHGGSGNDDYVVMPMLTGDVVLSGGHGNNTYSLSDAAASVVVDQKWLGVSDKSVDTLDFSSFQHSGVNVDISSVVPQQEGPLTLQLTDGMGISNVIGTQFVDTIIGNARNNYLQGAVYPVSTTAPTLTAAANSRTQWVLVDFDTFTPVGSPLHVYTAAERQAVIDQMNEYYRGSADPNSSNPWFDVRVTDNANDIPSTLQGNGSTQNQYITVYVNATPSNGQPGGQSSEIDPGNENLGGTALVQVNGSVGGAFQPADTSSNFVDLTARIASHEVGHLMGLEHSDSIGPIGFGTHQPLYPGQPNPAPAGAPAAFDTTYDIMSSPASVGTDRFTDLGTAYFGERDDIGLAIAFADPSAVLTTQQSVSTSLDSPQALTLASLSVPNTLGTDNPDYGKKFLVTAKQVDGHTNGESDFYRFYATKGEFINADAASAVLALTGGNTPIDSTIILRDPSGNVVATNNNGFETTDAQLVDYLAQATGNYTIEVDSANATAGDYRLTISTFQAADNPAPGGAIDILKGGPGVNTFNDGPGVNYGLALQDNLNTQSTQAGNLFQQNLSFTDPGGYSWAATVDFGDGSGVSGLPASQIDSVGQSLSLSHVFTKVGTYTVTVSLTNNNGSSDTQTFTVNVAANIATHFSVSSAASDVAGVSSAYTVTALDAYNNVATGYSGTVHFTSSDGFANQPTDSTLTSGVGSFDVTFNSLGNQSITATDTTNSSLSFSENVSVVPFISISESTSSAIYGDAVTFTATINPLVIGPFAGNVTFYEVDSSNHLIGTLGVITLNGNSSATFQDSKLSAKTHYIAVSYSGDPNFAGSSLSGAVTLTVTPYHLSYTIGNDKQTYGSPVNLAADLPSTIVTGVSGEHLAITYSSSGNTANASVAEYDITATLSDNSGLASNYNVTLTTGTLTVAAATLTITANNDSKVYGTVKTFGGTAFTAIGLVTANGDSISSVSEASVGASASAPVGSSPIIASAATGTGLSNYCIVYVNGSLTINAPPLSVLNNFKMTAFVGLNTGTIDLVDFQDPGALSSPTTYTATINWGDGRIDTNIPVAHSVADGTTIHVLGAHTYTAGGTYLPIVTLVSAAGASLSTTSANTSTVYVGTDISSLVTVTRTSAIKNRTTGLYISTVTITNISGSTLVGDIDLVLLNLTAGVTLTNANGTTAGGADPWVRFGTTGLAAGKSASVSLYFSLPTSVTTFNYSFKTFSVID